jgi:hypothetical protein
MGFYTPLSASVTPLLPLVGNDLDNALDRRLRRWLVVTSRTRKVPIVRPVPLLLAHPAYALGIVLLDLVPVGACGRRRSRAR